MGRVDHAKLIRFAAVLCAGASLAACATIEPRYPTAQNGGAPGGQGVAKIGKPYQINGKWYVPKDQPDYDEVGVASWYGDAFHLKATANGEVFDMNAVSGAHTTLPLPSIVEVTNLDNGRKLKVRVNDRGPFVGDRIIDLSHEAARELGYDRQGLANVRVRYVGPAPLTGPGPGLTYAKAGGKPPRRSDLPDLAERTREQAALAANVPAPSKAAARPILQTVQFTSAPAAGPPPLIGEELPPLGPSARPTANAVTKTVAKPAPIEITPAPRLAATGLRVQAGAFSQQANAQKAVDQLSPEGLAVIEPMQRGAVTLYRVVLPAPADEAEAYALRDRVAAIGFADARVVRAF